MTPKVKICGLTRWEDINAAVSQGASFLGFINAQESMRYLGLKQITLFISRIKKEFPHIQTVVVVTQKDPSHIEAIAKATGCDFLQIHSTISVEEFNKINFKKIKVFSVKKNIEAEEVLSYRADYYLFDTYNPSKSGGIGQVFNWGLVPGELMSKSFIAGGLNPENVGKLRSAKHPMGIDMNSGLELRPGVKSKAKIQKLFRKLAHKW